MFLTSSANDDKKTVQKIFSEENIMCLLFLPILIFIYGRLGVFLENAWEIKNVDIPVAAGLLILWGILIVFRKKIFEFLGESAYGFSGKAILIYILAVLTMNKYAGTYVTHYGGGLWSVIGSGLLLGVVVLIFMKGCEYILKALAKIKISKSDIIFIVLLYVFLNLQLVVYCRFLRHIFVWDNAGYFVVVDWFNDLFPTSEYFDLVFKSITENDYNYVIMFFASAFRKLFGNSRYVYLLSIVNIYLAPFIVMLHLTAKRFLKTNWVHTVCALLFFPFLIAISNMGFIDIGGILFTFAAVALFLNSDRPETALIAGICAALSVIMRRWYSFFALSFIISCFIYELPRKKCLKSIFTLAGFVFVLIFFFQDFVTGKLMADYKDMYSAYAFGIKADYFMMVRWFGIIAIAVLAVYALIKQIRSKSLVPVPQMFLGLQCLICFVIFTYVQTHGQQHMAMYISSLCYLFMMFVSDTMKRGKRFKTGVIVLCILQTANTFVLRPDPGSASELDSHALFPEFSSYPPRDQDVDEILKITEYLDREVGEKGKTACILASSLTLNYETIMNAEISLSKDIESDVKRSDYFLQLADVDKRDGFSENLYWADYVLVPDMPQTHLSPDEQKVMVVTHQMITNGEGFGGAFKKTDKKFSLPDGIEIYVYERTRDITPDEDEALKREIFGEGWDADDNKD